jgi:DNA helicase-2/ATP-dependent DNA helicase PcrA
MREKCIQKSIPPADLLKYAALGMQPVPDVRIKIANGQWIERALQQFTMSATTLSKFLRCPLAFYYENVLKVPFQKSDSLAFGSAVHYALENLFLQMKEKKGEFPDKNHLLGAFNAALYNESSCFTTVQFKRRMEQGHTILSDYYDRYINEFHKDVEIEWKVPRYLLNGIPVTGKIDKIEIRGERCVIIDYKTGDPEYAANAVTLPPNEKDELGGDYWRQMVFYTLILENYQEKNWKVDMGIFDFIQKNKSNEYKRITIPVYEKDKNIVKKQLSDTYSRIMNHEFDKGCGEESCHWCNFAKRYQLIRNVTDELIEIDER